MPRRKTMRRIKECFRLYGEAGLNKVQIARTLSIARSTVWDYLKKFEESGLSWEEIAAWSEEELERKLFTRPGPPASRIVPDFNYIHKELRRPGVTLQLLWEEYRQENCDGYGYSRFCMLYREWCKTLKIYMRQHHVGGEKVFVDYSGKKPCIYDPKTGAKKEVELFVMAWGASHYLYAEAQQSQTSKDWIMGHVRGFEYFGCVPRLVVPDNLKSAVTRACRYDPDINQNYTKLAEHYRIGVLPARPSRPKDKPKVETGVQIIQRWILARLRNRRFYSLAALNKAIRELLEEANHKPMQKLKKSRHELFEELDRPNAGKLPEQRYRYHEWLTCKVGFDYHIEVDKHYYSVPYQYYGKRVDIRLTERTLEVFSKSERICIHQRDMHPYHYTTLPEHMPPSHRIVSHWSPARLITWGRTIGLHTGKLIERIIQSKSHPEQGFRPARGIIRLGEMYGNKRLETACAIAGQFGLLRVREIHAILKNGRDRIFDIPDESRTVKHTENIRGKSYYETV
jgi:transposase